MTLPEFLGTVLGLILGAASAVAALMLGYGVSGMLIMLPVGFIIGWLIGAALSGPVDRALAKGEEAGNQDESDAEDPND